MPDEFEDWEKQEQEQEASQEYSKKCDALWQRGCKAGAVDSEFGQDLYNALATESDLTKAESLVKRLEADADYKRLEADFASGKVKFSEYAEARRKRQ